MFEVSPIFIADAVSTASRALLNSWVGVFLGVTCVASTVVLAQPMTSRVAAQQKAIVSPKAPVSPAAIAAAAKSEQAAAKKTEEEERKRLRMELRLHNQKLTNSSTNPATFAPQNSPSAGVPAAAGALGAPASAVQNGLPPAARSPIAPAPSGAAIDFGAPPPITGGDRRAVMTNDERQELRRQINESRKPAQPDNNRRGAAFPTPTEVER